MKHLLLTSLIMSSTALGFGETCGYIRNKAADYFTLSWSLGGRAVAVVYRDTEYEVGEYTCVNGNVTFQGGYLIFK